MDKMLLKGLLAIGLGVMSVVLSEARASRWFVTGQEADILLSAIGFNKTGGPLLFNHPGNVATDGTRLLMVDKYNNRVLIWTSLPGRNIAPDSVLGQKTFSTNGPGTGLGEMNFPVGVAAARGKVVVADAENNRLLIWKSFPTRNGQPADIVIDFSKKGAPKESVKWPWAVWTDGTKLIAASTGEAAVLIWKSFPTKSNEKASIRLQGRNPVDGTDRFGTPRTIGTDGSTYLVIGDENPKNESSPGGNFYWNNFPRADHAPYDFFMADPTSPILMWGGATSPAGMFLGITTRLSVWNTRPRAAAAPDLLVGKFGAQYGPTPCDPDGYVFQGRGGGSGIAFGGDKIFISLTNANKIVVYDHMPTSSSACPDYAIGASDIATNTLETHHIISGAVVATNGSSLFATSEHDQRLWVWAKIPTKSGTRADHVRLLGFAPWDNVLYGNTFVAAGHNTLQIWNALPTGGEAADTTFTDSIGPVSFLEITGVALDGRYLYVADKNGKLYVWDAVPGSTSAPKFILDRKRALGRISSDGQYLAVVVDPDALNVEVQIFSVDRLSDSARPVAALPAKGAAWDLNLARDVLVASGHLFVADMGNSRVLAWQDVGRAIAGGVPDVVLGQENLTDTGKAIGRDRLFMPATLAFAKDRLWAGEYKFSSRVVGFKAAASGHRHAAVR